METGGDPNLEDATGLAAADYASECVGFFENGTLFVDHSLMEILPSLNKAGAMVKV